MDARTKKLTDVNYSPTIPDSEENIRSQIDGSIQEVYDIVDEAKLDKTSGDYKGSWHGIAKPVYAEPGLAGVVDALDTDLTAHKADVAAHGDALNIYRSDKDANDIFTKIEWKLPNDKLVKKSILSGGTSPKYTTRTVTYYESDGVTIKLSKSYTITYDTNDDMTSEVTT